MNIATFSPIETSEERRQKIANDVARFLQLGGEVKQVSSSVYKHDDHVGSGSAANAAIAKQVEQKKRGKKK